MRSLACFALILVACSDLPTFETGVCGNYVIDPGETCDGDDPSCEACGLLCGGALPGEDCADAPGYACGTDGFCHAASGAFGGVSGEPALNASALAVTDVDQDNINDLVALSGTSLTVNYGDASGELAFQTSTLTPFFQAAPAFGHLDDDDSFDVILPTADGVVAYSSPHGVLSPHSFSIDLATTASDACDKQLGQSFDVFSVDEQYLGVLYTTGTEIGLALIDSSGRNACPKQVATLCSVPPGSDPRTFPLDVYDVSYPNIFGGLDPRAVVQSRVFALVTPSGACTANVTRLFQPVPSAPPFQVTTQIVAGVVGRPVLADLEGGGCPSLIDSHLGGPVITEHRGTGIPGGCGFAVATNPVNLQGAGVPHVVPLDATAVGHVKIDPPNGALRKDAIAMTSGIYAVASSRASGVEMYRADRPLAFVQTGDLDDDGDLDAVSIGAGVDDLDLLYRTPTGDTFLRVRVDTRGPLTQFVVGDFDGNHAADVAYTERVLGGDRLMLAYGTHDRVLDPVESGAFSLAVGLCPVQTSDTTDPHQLVSDLVIIDLPNEATPPIFTLLHGSPQRTMLSYFDPRALPFGTTPQSVFDGIAVGNLEGPADKQIDIFSIETGSSNTTRLWTMPNSATGLVFEPGVTASGVGPCKMTTGGLPATLDAFCTPGARYATWSLADRDVVLGIAETGPNRLVTLDPQAFMNGYAPRQSTALDGRDMLGVRSVSTIDLGGNRLVVALGPRMLPEQGAAQGAVLLCAVDAQGGVPKCEDLSAVIPELAGWRCVDAAAARIGGTTQLAVACHGDAAGALYRVFHDGAELRAAPIPVGPDVSGARMRTIERLVVGDVTGDALDDLLAVSVAFPDPEQHVLVIPQCSTTDLACIEDATGGGR